MGKFGNSAMLTPAEVWAATVRTLTDISAEEIFDLPEIDSVYPGASPASSSVANNFGSWAQLSADVGVGKRLIGAFVLTFFVAGGIPQSEIEFGEGADGSEAAITRVECNAAALSAAGFIPGSYFPLWRALSDNARLSVRAKDNSATVFSYDVNAMIA